MPTVKSSKPRAARARKTAPPVIVNKDHLAHWPSRADVASQLQVGVKTVDRMVARGQLRKVIRTIPGVGDRPFYHPEDVERVLKMKTEEAGRHGTRTELFTTPATAGTENRPAPALAPPPPRSVVPAQRTVIEVGAEAMGLSAAFNRIADNVIGLGDGTSKAAAQLHGLLVVAADAFALHRTSTRLFLSIREASTLGLPTSRLREMVRTGVLRNFGSPGRIRISRAQLEALARTPFTSE